MRIAGVTIPEKKRLEIALTAIYGVGRSRALGVLTEAGVDPAKRPDDVTTEEENRIRELIESEPIEGALRREISANIKRLKEIHAYRGIRHAKRLPAHGQRTQTNSRTVRGNVRKTMGSGKTKVEKK